MTDNLSAQAREVVEAVASALQQADGEGISEVRERLGEQDISSAAFRRLAAMTKPVCRYLDETIGEAAVLQPRLGAAMATIAADLRWVQSPSYKDDILGEGFSQNYAWCEVIGAEGFFRGNDFNLGFLLLGPNRHYLDHYHPAPELYWPLTGPTKWKKGEGAFEMKDAGSFIWHPSMTVHATITEDRPLLAAFIWTRHATIGARLCALDKA